MDYERLKFLVEELEKNYIPTDMVKREFFFRFFPEILEDDIVFYKVIAPKKLEINHNLNWLFFDKNCDNVVAFKDNIWAI